MTQDRIFITSGGMLATSEDRANKGKVLASAEKIARELGLTGMRGLEEVFKYSENIAREVRLTEQEVCMALHSALSDLQEQHSRRGKISAMEVDASGELNCPILL